MKGLPRWKKIQLISCRRGPGFTVGYRNTHIWSVVSKEGAECEEDIQESKATVLSQRTRYAALLKQCSARRDLHEGKLLHEQISKDGYANDTYLANLLVDMYGRCGSLQEATRVFEEIWQKNLFSWTILVTAYAQNGHEKQSVNLFRRMCVEGIRPDRVAFATVVGACSNIADVKEGRALHSAVVSADLEEEPVLRVALINMYAKAGYFSEAEALFRTMELKNAISYTAMIVAYTQFGKNLKALGLYREMHLQGVKPDRVTLLSVLGACSRQEDGDAVHFCISSSGIEDNDKVASALIQMYGRCQRVHFASRVFHHIPWSSVVVWNSMISAYIQNGQAEKALEIYGRMEMEGVSPDAVTIVEVLGVCGLLQQLRKGRAIHAQLSARQLDSDIIVIDTLLNMYRECGALDDAAKVFQQVAHTENPVAWNTMIAAYSEHGDPQQALELYYRMDLEGVAPSLITFVAVLGACSTLQALSEGRGVHRRIVSCGLETFPVLGNSLMQFYGACGQLSAATGVFERIQMKDDVSWNTIMGLYTQCKQSSKAVQVLQIMDLEGVKPNDMTFVNVLGACTSLGESTIGKAIHARVLSCGFQHPAIGSALVDMYAKCGMLDEAMKAFKQISSKTTVSWNTLISGYAQQGYSREALNFFREMQLAGLEADTTTFLIVLFACSHGGLIHEALACFSQLLEEQQRVAVTEEHYCCLIDLLARAGWLDKAEDLIRSMPFEPDSTSWTSLLGACNMHGDVRRGSSIVAAGGVEDDVAASPYVMLSNMFTNVYGS